MTRLQCTDKKNFKTSFDFISRDFSIRLRFYSIYFRHYSPISIRLRFYSIHLHPLFRRLPASTPFVSTTVPSSPSHYSVASSPLFCCLRPSIYFIVSSPFFRRFCLYYNFLRHYSVVSSFPPFGLLFRLLHMFKGAGTSAAFLLVPPWFTATGIKVVGGGGL